MMRAAGERNEKQTSVSAHIPVDHRSRAQRRMQPGWAGPNRTYIGSEHVATLGISRSPPQASPSDYCKSDQVRKRRPTLLELRLSLQTLVLRGDSEHLTVRQSLLVRTYAR